MSAIANHAACKQWNKTMIDLTYESKWDELTPFPCEKSCPHHWSNDSNGPLSFIRSRIITYEPKYTSYPKYPVFTQELEDVILRMYGPMTTTDWCHVLYYHGSIPFARYLLQTGKIHLEHPIVVDFAYRYLFDKQWANFLFIEYAFPVNLLPSRGDSLLHIYIATHFKDSHYQCHPDDERPIPPMISTLLRLGADPLLPNKYGETPIDLVHSLRTYPRSKYILLNMLEQYA